jgi:sugar lactone lactonase YvrE
MTAVEVWARAGAIVGEGPCWDDVSQTLWWVDIEGCRVHASTQEATATFTVADEPGAVVLTTDPGVLLVASGVGFATLDARTGVLAPPLATLPDADPAVVRLNDAKAGPDGRFYAGTKSWDDGDGRGTLYVLDGDAAGAAAARPLFAPVGTSNGLGWSADGTVLYYVDSHRADVLRFAFDAATGTLGPPRAHADLRGLRGTADGLAVDADDNLWIAFWGGAVVRCFHGATGALLRELAMPVSNPTSCAFGGPGGELLLVTTAALGAEDEDLAGSVLAVAAGVRGAPPHRARIPGTAAAR